MPKIIASIANYNTAKLLEKCVSSIFSETKGIDFEVWVFDNGSKDNSAENIKKKFPKVKLVQNKENIGFGKAHNKVFELTNSEYFAIINSDIEFKNNVLKALSDCLGSKEKVAAVSCKLLSPDQSVQENISVFPTLPLELLARIPFVQNPYSPKKDYSLSQEVKSFNGACFLVRRSAIKGKLFDEDYFAYAEETDLFYRLKKIGWKIFFEPKAIAIHYGGASSKKVEAQLLHLNGLKLFFEKNHNKFSEKIFLLICLFSAAVGFFVAFFVSNKERKDFCKRIIKACWKDFL